MTRRAAAIVVALALNPALLYAQDMALTVTAQSADVFKGPSNVTPVIGHVERGTVVAINRNLGSWVKISWPGGIDGAGYVHVTMGRIAPANHDGRTAAPSATQPSAAAADEKKIPMPPPANIQAAQRAPLADVRPAPASAYIAPASHIVGVGALVGYSRSIGASTRIWPNEHLGIHFSATRNTLTGDPTVEPSTAWQFEPGIIYGLFDRITDYVWIRPYVGSAVGFRHQPATAQFESSDTIALRVFGGAEFTFASAPRFGVSADVGYRHLSDTIPGFEVTPVAVSIAGHWYMR